MNPEWWDKDNRIVVILRVSSHRQSENSSHETQLEEIKIYCAANGLQIERVFKLTESAKESEDRRQYREANRWTDKQRIKHQAFYMFDRESRNLTDNESNERAVREGRRIIHYVRDRKVIHRGSSDSDFLIRDFQAVTNKHFIRNLSAKVNDAMRAKAEDGWFPGNRPPLGYIHQHVKGADGRTKKRGTIIVPDTNTQRIKLVQREFELRAARHTLVQIRETIIREKLINGIEVPHYHVSTIDRRLRNKFYRGQFDWQGIEYQGAHELIIPQNVLDQVDESLGLKARYTKKQQQGIFGGGWLKCGECGCHVLYDPKTKTIKSTGEIKTYHLYHCTNGKGVHQNMKGLNVKEELIWQGLTTAVDEITISKELAEQIADALNKTHQRACDAVRREIAGFTRALDEIEFRRNKLVDLMMDETLSKEEYRTQVTRLDQERKRLTTILEKAQLSFNGAYLKTAQDVLELATRAKSLWIDRTPSERKMFLERVVSNPMLEGSRVRYELRKPFAVLAGMARSEDWRPLRDSNSCLLREREPS